MAGAGEFNLPVDVGVRDFSGDGFGGADAAAVGTAEAGPFLGNARPREGD